jgi:hypothetical protein
MWRKTWPSYPPELSIRQLRIGCKPSSTDLPISFANVWRICQTDSRRIEESPAHSWAITVATPLFRLVARSIDSHSHFVERPSAVQAWTALCLTPAKMRSPWRAGGAAWQLGHGPGQRPGPARSSPGHRRIRRSGPGNGRGGCPLHCPWPVIPGSRAEARGVSHRPPRLPVQWRGCRHIGCIDGPSGSWIGSPRPA